MNILKVLHWYPLNVERYYRDSIMHGKLIMSKNIVSMKLAALLICIMF